MDIIELLKTVVIGVIQGITEWLPISSTGHMILADQLIHVKMAAADPAFWEMFLVIIQFGSILAVLTLYFHKLNPFSPKKSLQKKRQTWSLWAKVLVASIPAGVVGLLLDDFITGKLYGYVTVAVALIVYGVAFILIENRRRKPKIESFEQLTYKTAFFIGMFQMLSLIPGTSRSGSTILGAVLLGCSRYVSAEFSFFMAVPAMLGASGYKLLKYFLKAGFGFTSMQLALFLVGLFTAFVVSVFAIKFLMSFIKKHDFKPFGWYRIALGAVVLLYFLCSEVWKVF